MQLDRTASALKNRIAEIWDSRATSYDPLYGHGLRSRREQRAWLSLLGRLLPPEKPLRVLDVGVGTGFLALLIRQLGHQVTGIDFSDRMLSVARTKAEQDQNPIALVRGDAESLPFADSSFDAVISRALLWTLLEPAQAIQEWRRVTRPGGLVAAIDGLWIDHNRWLRWVVKRIQELSSGHRKGTLSYHAELCKRLPLRKTVTTAHAIDLFRGAGLNEVRTERLNWLDDVESKSMTFSEKITYRYQRYLVAATRT